MYRCLTLLILVFLLPTQASALRLQDCVPLSDKLAAQSRDEHMFGGRPDTAHQSQLFERRAFVVAYDEKKKVPAWAAWYAISEYRDTPKREGKWSTFRSDPTAKTASSKDYVGWYDSDKNYARGHLVPYFISGGDRDGDGEDAEVEATLKIADTDDACTVYEINSMINIAPQYHAAFNGKPGLWWDLETDVRHMVDNQRRFNLFAGTVFKQDLEIVKIGNRKKSSSTWNIAVPHGFWKIVIDPASNEAVGFLFDHSADLEHGCSLETVWSSGCIVPIEIIEEATGLSFFTEVEAEMRGGLRSTSSKETWKRWLGL